MRPPQPRQIGAVNWLGLRALTRRGVVRFLKEGLESIGGPAVSSLLFLAVFALAASGMREVAPGMELVEFIAPGLVIFALSHTAYETGAVPLLYDKMEGMIADLLAAPLSALELLCGYLLSALFNGLVVGTTVLVMTCAFTDYRLHAPWAVILFAVMAALLFAAVGAIVGLWADRWENYSAAESFLVLPLGFLSGAFFSVKALPDLAGYLIAFNPVYYLIDGFRYGLTGYAETDLTTGALLVGGLTAVLLLVLWQLFAQGYKIKP